MNNDRGIIFLSFGASYDQLAARTAAASRQFTTLPYHVLTNLTAAQRSPDWQHVANVTFTVLNVPDDQNRGIKLQIYKYSPFAQALHFDSDAVIMRPGIEALFDLLNTHDIALLTKTDWQVTERLSEVIVRDLRILGLRLPQRAWYGGVFLFNRDAPTARAWFDSWYKCWVRVYRQWDSIALIAATRHMQNYGLKIAMLPSDTMHLKPDHTTLIWHPQIGKYRPFCRHLKIPEWIRWQPAPSDWTHATETTWLPPKWQLRATECRDNGPLCIMTQAYGAYVDFVPLFILSALWAYPEAIVHVYCPEALPERVNIALDNIRKQLSPNFEIIIDSTLFSAQYTEQQRRCLRWLTLPERLLRFKYAYICDVDFVIMRTRPDLLTFHTAHMAKFKLPYSNVRRWNYPDRVSGLHFIDCGEYRARVAPILAAYQTQIPHLTQNNERTLSDILTAAGIPAPHATSESQFAAMRPHPGLHLGLTRNNMTPGAYRSQWLTLGTAAANFLASPLVTRIISTIVTPWIKTSVASAMALVANPQQLARLVHPNTKKRRQVFPRPAQPIPGANGKIIMIPRISSRIAARSASASNLRRI